MGTFTPNIGLYLPANGETNYVDSFNSGMLNLDQHDHTGGPNKGLPITTTGLANFSVTFNKLNSNVADILTGIGTNSTPGLQNQLQILGVLKNLFTFASGAGTGFISINGATVEGRTFQDSPTATWTNADGVGGEPSVDFNIAGISPVGVSDGGTGVTSLTTYDILLGGTTTTGPIQQVDNNGNLGEGLISQGAGAKPIWSPQVIQTATVTLTAAQFNALNLSRVLAIPAPGANKMNLVVAAVAKLNWAASFTTTKNVPLYYGGSSTFTTDFGSNAFSPGFGGGASSYWFANPDDAGIAGYPIADIQNADIYIGATAASTGGAGSTIDFEIKYTTINL